MGAVFIAPRTGIFTPGMELRRPEMVSFAEKEHLSAHGALHRTGPLSHRRKAEIMMPTKADLEAEVENLKQQLAAVRDQSAEVADTFAQRVNGYVGHAVETGTHRAQAAIDTGVQSARTAAHETALCAQEAENAISTVIRERPLLSVGIAFAAGMMMCKASSVAGRRS